MKHILSAVFKKGWKIIFCYFGWMNKYSKHPEKTPLEVRYKKVSNLITDVLKTMNVQIEVLGKENIVDGTACYFGNHLSAGDPLVYFDIFEKPIAFVGKKEVKKMPFVGKMFASADGLFLDRQDLKQELRVMMKVQSILENKQSNVFIFPEGTRNRDPLMKLIDFHHGTFRSAMKAGVPIVPVVCYGAHRILSTKYDYKSYPVTVKFLTPIYPDEYEKMTTQEVAIKVQSAIEKELTFNIRAIDNKKMSLVKGDTYSYNTIY